MFPSRKGIFTIAISGDGIIPMAQHFRSFLGTLPWNLFCFASFGIRCKKRYFWLKKRILRCHPRSQKKKTLTRDKNRPSPRIKKAAAVRFMYFSAEDGHGGWMFWGLQSKPNDNDGLEKGTPFKHGNLLVSMLHFFGCLSYIYGAFASLVNFSKTCRLRNISSTRWGCQGTGQPSLQVPWISQWPGDKKDQRREGGIRVMEGFGFW